MAKWEGFQQCPGCGMDIFTGEGERSCAWGDCPYLPQELDPYCAYCRFNFFTMEGNPPCEDPMTCEYAAEPLNHVLNLKKLARAATAPVTPPIAGPSDSGSLGGCGSES